MSMEKKFDYDGAVAELEKIAARVEDPATGLDEIDRCIRRSDELIRQCREYLRTVRDTIDNL
ncbi:Exodeoxyribonuclease VII small subunit [Bacteroidales bacterium WCE2004]|nr:exodeoxyribonuclease VII small subunit [Bacteroidales bacterium]SKC62180.1 Exodeoxyribonuclease VII small subunit [Bacteroidales bacterium WCE2004]